MSSNDFSTALPHPSGADNKGTDATPARADVAARQTSNQYGIGILAILSLLMAFASISTDLYLPALPAMAATLHASAGVMELTISGYLIGFSLGQLLWGPISDRRGRRLPIAIGLVMFIAGSAGCALSISAPMLVAFRGLQAAGACASVVLARAMVRDLYAGPVAAQMMSKLMTVMAIAPLIGPSLGGAILHLASWRALFWTLVGVGVATLAALYTLPETLPQERRNREPLTRALATYASLVSHKKLLGYMGTGGFFYGATFAYIAGSPFAYISYHHASPQFYGLLFGVGIVGIMVMNQVNARLIPRFGSDRLMRGASLVAAVAGLLLALDASTDFGGLAGLVVPAFLMISMSGMIIANSIAGALGLFPEVAGSVSALVGAAQYGTGIIGSALVGWFADGTPSPMGFIIAAMNLGAFICAALLVRRVATPKDHR